MVFIVLEQKGMCSTTQKLWLSYDAVFGPFIGWIEN